MNPLLFSTTPLAPTRVCSASSNMSEGVCLNMADEGLLQGLSKYQSKDNLEELTKSFPGKTVQEVIEMIKNQEKRTFVKGTWTRVEDELIMNWVRDNGARKWSELAKLLPGRLGKQCRERWKNSLDPSKNRASWTPQEDRLIMQLRAKLGNKWSKIAEHLPGRTDNSVKNRWNSTLCRRKSVIRKVNNTESTKGFSVSGPILITRYDLPFNIVYASERVIMGNQQATGTEPKDDVADYFLELIPN